MRAGREMGPAGIALGGILAAAGPKKTIAETRIRSRNAAAHQNFENAKSNEPATPALVGRWNGDRQG